MAGDGPVYLTEDTARRVANAVRAVERDPRSTLRQDNPPRLFIPVRDAFTTSAIGARTGNKLGSGTARYVIPAGSDGITMTYTSEAEFTAFNNTGGAIPIHSFGYVVSVAGKLRFIEADCLWATSPGTPVTP